ncbi:MAG: 3-dehydroquinate synthase [Flavobacteriaceae bacterium]|nr:3-dehydroquinate synthase [Flavobacteriaceae bacterium]
MEKKIIRDRGAVFCNEGAWEMLHDIISEIQPSKVFVLTDEHTEVACLPYFMECFNHSHSLIHLSIPSGEEHKSITTCLEVWNQLSEKGADRKSLLINLGGGVVTDLGGFVACTYQRGIEFINIPTSLLAMVDASVGGKNGVDLGVLKNQVGVITNPKAVIVDTYFLETLPEEQFKSGISEMIKHGIIHSEVYLEQVMAMDENNGEEVSQLIWDSILIKNDIITQDPLEKGIRKALNYGHTLGHAIESYCLKSTSKESLLHGEAIAIGMILATYISSEQYSFPKKKMEKITMFLLKTFGKVDFSKDDIDEIIKLLIFDKKNNNGKIQFVLLENIGKRKLNCSIPNTLIYEAFNFYANFHF